MQDAEIEMLSAYIAAIECVRRVMSQTRPDTKLYEQLKEADVALNTAVAEEMHNLTLDYGAESRPLAETASAPSAVAETGADLPCNADILAIPGAEPLPQPNTSAQPTPGDLPADETVAEPPKAGL